jgi:FHA domain
MEIVHIHLEAINPSSKPQIIPIPITADSDHIIGRSTFYTGEDTIISRRHASFTILQRQGHDILIVRNLSMINGILVNSEPVHPLAERIIRHGDEIVCPPLLFVGVTYFVVFFRGTWVT